MAKYKVENFNILLKKDILIFKNYKNMIQLK